LEEHEINYSFFVKNNFIQFKKSTVISNKFKVVIDSGKKGKYQCPTSNEPHEPPLTTKSQQFSIIYGLT